jgi:hypothetical protein
VKVRDVTIEVQERAAQNQALFREVNDRVKSLNATLLSVLPRGDWICECADTACFERIEMSIEEYVALRRDPHRFAVAPEASHVVQEAEQIVEYHDGYWVVEKVGVSARVAEQLAVPAN